MPALANPKHEAFAQAVVQGMNNAQAYEAAGYTSKGAAASVGANRLLKDNKIVERIAELRSRQDTSFNVVLTKTWVIEETIQLMREARIGKAYGPAAKCLELLAREVNAFVEKKEIGAPGEFADLRDDELIAIVRSAVPSRSGEGRASRKGTGHTPDSETLQ